MAGATLYQRLAPGKRGRLERSTLFGYQGCAIQPEISADVSPYPRLARIRRNVQTGARSPRKSPQAALCRRRPLPGDAAPDLSPRQGRAFDRAGLCRPRAQGAGQGRHDLPHLFDDQAAHHGRLHDAGRGGPRRAGRARAQIHSGMEEPRRVRGRHAPGLPDPSAGAADADRGPAAPHLGPYLWFPAAQQCRRRLSREQDRRSRSRPARCKP